MIHQTFCVSITFCVFLYEWVEKHQLLNVCVICKSNKNYLFYKKKQKVIFVGILKHLLDCFMLQYMYFHANSRSQFIVNFTSKFQQILRCLDIWQIKIQAQFGFSCVLSSRNSRTCPNVPQDITQLVVKILGTKPGQVFVSFRSQERR